MIPFAATEAERQRAGDPRSSLETRYASRDAWAARLAAATDHLVTERLLLAEDGDRLLAAARESWDCTRRYKASIQSLGPGDAAVPVGCCPHSTSRRQVFR